MFDYAKAVWWLRSKHAGPVLAGDRAVDVKRDMLGYGQAAVQIRRWSEGTTVTLRWQSKAKEVPNA